MSRTHKLDPVMAQAKQATESALLKLGQSHSELNRDELQLAELKRYRQDYLRRFRQADPAVMTAKQALDLRSFLAQLDHTIQAHEQQVEQRRQQVSHHQQRWLESRQKEQALNTLNSRYQQTENQRQARQQQRESDEHTNASWLRRQREK